MGNSLLIRPVDTSQYKRLSIIIPNYNGAHLIKRFFPSVLKALSNYKGEFEIIFVDDASTDDSVLVINEFANKNNSIKLVAAKTNGGFSRSCNMGIASARMEICFFLNTDVILDEHIFEYYGIHFNDPSVFAVTICGFKMGSSEQIDGIRKGLWLHGKLRSTENFFDSDISRLRLTPPYRSLSVQGAYFFADTNKLRELNGFDEIYSPYLFEETDLCYRALKRNWQIIYEPQCRGEHQVSATIKSAASVFRVKTIAARNQLFFTWKNIHSTNLMASHFFFLFLRLITFNLVVWTGLIKALLQIVAVIKKRRTEKIVAVRTDSVILRDFAEYFQGTK